MAVEKGIEALATEGRNPETLHIDRMGTVEALETINRLDQEVAPAVARVIPSIAALVDAATDRMACGGRIIYMGAGTSGRLGVLDASECPPTYGVAPDLFVGLIAGGRDALVSAREGVEDSKEEGASDLKKLNLRSCDVVIGLAASGRTPYVIGGLEYAREVGALTGSVACVAPSRLSEVAELPIDCPIGPEPITGSTRMRSGTAQKLILNMISTELMVKAGKVYENLMVDVQPSNEKLVDRAQRIIRAVSGVSEAESREMLERAGRNVKVAICMAVSGCEALEAQARLEAQGGNVAAAIRSLSE